MNLEEALDGWPASSNQSGGGGIWPGQPSNPGWPGQPTNPTWPGGQPSPNPTWPGGQPSPNPAWPGGQPSPNPAWPGGQPSPNPAWPGGPSPGPTVPTAPQQSLSVPFQMNLPNGVFDKLLITIAGVIKPNADKVTVDFTTPQDLVFHLNPRFNDEGRQVIVRNSCIGKKWGKEERELTTFPFARGQPFEMKILCTNSEFKVAVNNSHLLSYKHRVTSLRAINTVSVYNDVTLTRVHMETLP